MTVGELKEILKDLPDDMLIAAPDEHGISSEISSAGAISDPVSGLMYFYIHPNGGYPIFDLLQ